MKKTITETIKEVLLKAGKPLTVFEVYEAIIAAKLYDFKADEPIHVVRSQIRRHCRDLNFPSASEKKFFEVFPDGKYYVLQSPFVQARVETSNIPEITDKELTQNDLKQLHQKYLEAFREKVLEGIKKLDPYDFERFCRNLLKTYDFQDVKVTKKSKDDGIDGYGRYKVGLTFINAAFQCKLWKTNAVGSKEIDQFKGAIQGKYELGFFFTTAKFSTSAQTKSSQPGAVPIILIDGFAIVDIMIQNNFGIEIENLPLYNLALDNAISED